jgi:hypothetical protein
MPSEREKPTEELNKFLADAEPNEAEDSTIQTCAPPSTGSARRCRRRRENIGANVGVPIVMC